MWAPDFMWHTLHFSSHTLLSPLLLTEEQWRMRNMKKKQKPCAVISSYSSAGSVEIGKGEGRLSGRRWWLEGYGHQHHPVPQEQKWQEDWRKMSTWSSRILHRPHVIYNSRTTTISATIPIFKFSKYVTKEIIWEWCNIKKYVTAKIWYINTITIMQCNAFISYILYYISKSSN